MRITYSEPKELSLTNKTSSPYKTGMQPTVSAYGKIHVSARFSSSTLAFYASIVCKYCYPTLLLSKRRFVLQRNKRRRTKKTSRITCSLKQPLPYRKICTLNLSPAFSAVFRLVSFLSHGLFFELALRRVDDLHRELPVRMDAHTHSDFHCFLHDCFRIPSIPIETTPSFYSRILPPPVTVGKHSHHRRSTSSPTDANTYPCASPRITTQV